MTKCHVCRVDDEPANLSQVNAGSGEAAYAHPLCIKRHNKEVQKNLRALHVSITADHVLDRDIDPDDSWRVECLLRKEYPELRKQPSILGVYPKLSRQFIAEVAAAARNKRDAVMIPNKLQEPRERSAYIPGLGTVYVKAARCGCGRPIEPRDFERTDDGVRVVCAGCHTVVHQIELDVEELDHDED